MVMRWTLFGILTLLVVGCSEPQDPTASVDRVLLIGIDQLSHERVDALIERGDLPNFARLTREGSRGVAIAPDPLLHSMLWSTALTGKGVAQHEVTADLVQLDADTRCLAPSSMRAVRNLFQVAGLEGVPLAAVGFPGTWPAETVNGFLVSDGTAPSRWTQTREHNFDRVGGFMDTFPPALYPEIEPMLREVDELERELVSRFFVFQETEYRMLYDAPLGSIYKLENPPKDFAITLQRDRSHLDILHYLIDRYSPRLAGVHLGLLGAIQPVYWPFSRPELYETPADSRRRFGDSVDEAYRWIDEQIGLLMESLPPRSVVCVVSEQGYSDGPDPRDPDSGKMVSMPSNEASFFLWGQGIRRGFDLGRVSIADTTPTLLRVLDAAVGDDMDGQVLERALTDEWADAHREKFISSYDENWDQSLRYPPRSEPETTPPASEPDEETP